MPNNHAIYLHDTPAQALFARPVRAFSHGCIRTQNVRDFAAVRRTEVAFAAGVALDLELPAAQVDAFSRFVRDLTRGRGVVEAVP